MALDRGGEAEEVGARERLAKERVARDEAPHGRRRRRPKPSRQRNRVPHLHPPPDALRDLAADLAQRRLDTLDTAVLAVGRQLARPLAVHREFDLAPAPAADLDLDPVRQPEGDGQTVVARAEVRTRCRDLDLDPSPIELGQPVRHHPSATVTDPTVG
jgi:hypothetical protein